mmetsp:Transcript_25360/g.81996  ORF Transcript_25360/g.81996 Transcript_25360/m.81996 type:complete len:273 (-) Transcript_25360:522-1340(-)
MAVEGLRLLLGPHVGHGSARLQGQLLGGVLELLLANQVTVVVDDGEGGRLGGAIAHARQLSVEDDLRLVVVEDLLAANGAREDPKRPDEEDDQHEKERKVDLLEHVYHVLLVPKGELGEVLQDLGLDHQKGAQRQEAEHCELSPNTLQHAAVRVEALLQQLLRPLEDECHHHQDQDDAQLGLRLDEPESVRLDLPCGRFGRGHRGVGLLLDPVVAQSACHGAVRGQLGGKGIELAVVLREEVLVVGALELAIDRSPVRVIMALNGAAAGVSQ